jgi:hypothetical protein
MPGPTANNEYSSLSKAYHDLEKRAPVYGGEASYKVYIEGTEYEGEITMTGPNGGPQEFEISVNFDDTSLYVNLGRSKVHEFHFDVDGTEDMTRTEADALEIVRKVTNAIING